MFRNTHLWLPAYARQQWRTTRTSECAGPVHVMFCFVDHFEPMWRKPSYQEEVRRIDTWTQAYAKMAARHRDADGGTPKHTLFYPAEEYRPEHLEKLARFCREGWAEVEIHLHHDRDTDRALEGKIETFKGQLLSHGLLSTLRSHPHRVGYGFVHGNWALDNSDPDGRHCGVNNELQVLRKTGCYADFTLPSAPSTAQTRTINSIYYATDDPARPKSHDTGVPVEAGGQSTGDLMIVQGPLALNWRRRKWSLLPRIENSDVSHTNPPKADRVDLWVQQQIHVNGRPDWIFVKVHTHGLQPKNLDLLCGSAVDEMFAYLGRAYNDGQDHLLHYVTAREMYNIIKAAEAGLSGNPDLFRDYCFEWRGRQSQHRVA
jgi:hypothetical protein